MGTYPEQGVCEKTERDRDGKARGIYEVSVSKVEFIEDEE